jgi:hypothetical protein
MQSPDYQLLEQLRQLLEKPFWTHYVFWLELSCLVVGLVGAVVSYFAYLQAEGAKQEAERATIAALDAGRTVKLQTMSIELTEVAHKLERLHLKISFNEAKDLYRDASFKLVRLMAPFENDAGLRAPIEALWAALDAAREALKNVRPTDPNLKEDVAPESVYYGVEDSFATISTCLARVLGMIENQTVDRRQ